MAERDRSELSMISQLYDKGAEFIRRYGHRANYGSSLASDFASEVGLSRESLSKARKLAQAYTPEEFQELCGLRTPDGKPLGVGHIYCLMSISDRRRRRALQRRAAELGWSSRELAAQAKRAGVKSTSRRGGRSVPMPRDVKTALIQLNERTSTWLRWFAAWQLNGNNQQAAPALPKQIEKRLVAANKAVEALKKQLLGSRTVEQDSRSGHLSLDAGRR